jgi:hypothetical protein
MGHTSNSEANFIDLALGLVLYLIPVESDIVVNRKHDSIEISQGRVESRFKSLNFEV